MRFRVRPPGAAATLALLLAVAAGAGAGQAAPTVPGAQALSRHGRLQRLGAHPRLVAPFVSSSHGARPAIGSGRQYTISDVGAPPNTTNYGPPGPLGFNNTVRCSGLPTRRVNRIPQPIALSTRMERLSIRHRRPTSIDVRYSASTTRTQTMRSKWSAACKTRRIPTKPESS